MSDIINTFVEVKLKDKDDFLKIKETLTRIGVASKMEKKLTQSCHILHKQGKYYLLHFKELFALDGKNTDFSEDDKARRNSIIKLLVEWELLNVVEPKKIENPIVPISFIKIISHKEKKDWVLCSKYNIGKKR